VLCAAVAHPAAAQSPSRASASPDAPRATVAVAVARPVAEYRITTGQLGFPEHVSLADSAGRLVASYRVNDADTPRPMALTVRGQDLVLRTDTPAGPLTIVLKQQIGDVAPVFVGRWRMGDYEGRLQGSVQR
jgi:hypothetical protein